MKNLNLEKPSGKVVKDYIKEAKRLVRSRKHYDEVVKPALEKLSFDFPVSVVPSIYESHIAIFLGLTPETDEDKKNEFEKTKERNYHKLVVGVVRGLGVKLDRHFNQYSGKFSWQGSLDDGPKIPEEDQWECCRVRIELDTAPAGECKIIKVVEPSTTIKYKAECF